MPTWKFHTTSWDKRCLLTTGVRLSDVTNHLTAHLPEFVCHTSSHLDASYLPVKVSPKSVNNNPSELTSSSHPFVSPLTQRTLDIGVDENPFKLGPSSILLREHIAYDREHLPVLPLSFVVESDKSINSSGNLSCECLPTVTFASTLPSTLDTGNQRRPCVDRQSQSTTTEQTNTLLYIYIVQ